jgi:TIR domain-containing protein
MPDVFISYRSENRELVAPVAKRLAALGLDIWFDQKVTRWGALGCRN